MCNVLELGTATPLAIASVGWIQVWDRREGGRVWILPSLSTTEGIPTLWHILHLIPTDWEQAAREFAVPPDCVDVVEKCCHHSDAFEQLKPRFIQSLFSYVNFFFTLENGFQVLLSELRELARELALHIELPKQPNRPPYVDKLRRVRNHTVIHWGGPKHKYEIDSRAGRRWGFSWPSEATDLTDLEFGSESLVGAEDRVLRPIRETHTVCVEYLKEYDKKCAILLQRILSHLPMTIGTRDYIHRAFPSKDAASRAEV